ncbi:MAG: glycosyltransferase family 9 protein [Gemmatimonadetes bacterium]|nr:glycosyltransferase family 9 protein [Gemmatimonadota bacterium]
MHNGWGSPGDTISTGTLVRQVHERFPRLRINVVTRHAELLAHEPAIATLNAPPTALHLTFWYPGLLRRKARTGSVLEESSAALGGMALEYRARVTLTDAERAWGEEQLAFLPAPRIAFNTKSKEVVKDWPEERWAATLRDLAAQGCSLVHLGDDREPAFPGVTRLAGRLDLRESMAVLAAVQLHMGPDSFLMHAANGLGVRSVIVFGGSRPAACLGYPGNENLDVEIDCGPCWLHSSKGEQCPRGLACLQMITPAQVVAAAGRLLARTTA